MNWDQLAGKWTQMSGALKERWAELTDDEIAQMQGNREQLEGKIQERYGKSKAQAKEEVTEFLARL